MAATILGLELCLEGLNLHSLKKSSLEGFGLKEVNGLEGPDYLEGLT